MQVLVVVLDHLGVHRLLDVGLLLARRARVSPIFKPLVEVLELLTINVTSG